MRCGLFGMEDVNYRGGFAYEKLYRGPYCGMRCCGGVLDSWRMRSLYYYCGSNLEFIMAVLPADLEIIERALRCLIKSPLEHKFDRFQILMLGVRFIFNYSS